MLAVKNFDKFQHYKDRSPVWIKLYRSLLRDYEFAKLPDAARGQLVLIWLLASEMGNRLPNDAEWIKCQINASDPVNLSVLIETGFLIDCDSKSDSNHDASDMMLAQRREREETEKEREEEASREKPRSVRAPVLPDDEFLDGLQKNPAYSMLNVRHCYQRMMTWCQVNSKQPSRRRFINWLNREDKPMTANGRPPKKPDVGATPPPRELPADETDAFMSEHIDDLIAADDLIQLGHEYDAIVLSGGAKTEWQIRCVAYYELHKNEPATPEQLAQLNASIDALAKR